MDNEAHKFFFTAIRNACNGYKIIHYDFPDKKMILRKILMQISDSQKRFRRPPNFNGLLFWGTC